MPELPEVEQARAAVEAGALGRSIRDVDDTDDWVCRPHEPGEIREALVGRSLTAARRRGKTMWCETSDDGPLLGLHLGMAGRLHVTDAAGGRTTGGDRVRGADGTGPGGKPEWFRFTVTFDDGGALRLFDKRRLGRVRLDPDLDALGPDAEEVGLREFRERVGRGTAPLKARLLDQAVVAGIGNLLADQVLWQARLDPHREAGGLDPDELRVLHRELGRAIRSATSKGGVHTGEVIRHRRRGEDCPRCGAAMASGQVGGRTTWWCSREQVA